MKPSLDTPNDNVKVVNIALSGREAAADIHEPEYNVFVVRMKVIDPKQFGAQ